MTSMGVLGCTQDVATARILIADDDDAFRACMAELLACSGYSCETAPDGAAAFERAVRGDIDLVLADVYMPGNYHLELVRALSDARIPVVLMTAYPDLNAALDAARLTSVTQVAKPVHFPELLDRVTKALAGLPGRAGAA